MIINNKWHKHFLDMCSFVAKMSKDSSRQVGCVFTTLDNRVLMTGFNGIPSRLIDLDYRLQRPEKYNWVCHAEMNCIDIGAKEGIKLSGSCVYVNYYPCVECAGHLVNVGISKLVTYKRPDSPEYKDYGFEISEQKFEEAGIEVIEY